MASKISPADEWWAGLTLAHITRVHTERVDRNTVLIPHKHTIAARRFLLAATLATLPATAQHQQTAQYIIWKMFQRMN